MCRSAKEFSFEDFSEVTDPLVEVMNEDDLELPQGRLERHRQLRIHLFSVVGVLREAFAKRQARVLPVK